MLKSLLSAALGNLAKDKTASALNTLVLTGIITCALLVLLNILYESGYDRYHVKAENLYRIVSNIDDGNNKYMWDVSQASLAPELVKRYPEVKNAARFSCIGRTVFRNGNKSFEEEGFYAADSSVFEMFTYEFIAGDPKKALVNPYSMVLTEKIAKKYFGSAWNAMNQTLRSANGEAFVIKGVMKDVPANSHFIFDALISPNSGKGLKGGWANFSTHTYIELPTNYNSGRMCGHLKTIAREKLHPIADQVEVRITYQLQPLTQIHKAKVGSLEAGNCGLFYFIAGMTLLVIASLWFFNRSRNASSDLLYGEALKESIGVRRRMLILQLITESVCITIISFIISAALVYALLPVFNDLMNKEIPLSLLWHSSVVLTMVAVFLFAGFVGALYPSFYLPKMEVLEQLRRNAMKKEEIFFV